MSIFSIDPLSRTPVYEQVITQVEKYIALGLLAPGDPMPSVRSLSIELSINPNTTQKAFNELSGRGILVSVPGRGSFISQDAQAVIREHSLARLHEFETLARQLHSAGITEDELTASIHAAVTAMEDKEVSHDQRD